MCLYCANSKYTKVMKMWQTILQNLPGWKVLFWSFLSFLIPYGFSKVYVWLRQEEWVLKKWRKVTVSKTAGISSWIAKEGVSSDPLESNQLCSELASNLNLVESHLGNNSDFTIRQFKLGRTNRLAAITCINGVSDKQIIQELILKPLMKDLGLTHFLKQASGQDICIKNYIKDHVLSISDLDEAHTLEQVISKIISGSTVLFIDGISGAFILGTKADKSRNIEDPVSEPLVRGPKIGFVESLENNIAILRMMAPDSNLKILESTKGYRNPKKIVIAYTEGIVLPNLVEEVIRRMESIHIDDLLESGYIEQLIEDDYLSPFPQVQNTERPDRVVGALLEGRVAILLDGTPSALIVPVTFSMLLQTPEDYYERWIPGSFFRLLRFSSALIALFGPAVYIAFSSFHQGLIPTKLAISIAAHAEGVPFKPFLEALIMEVSIEILREAGLRMPKPVGQTVGIVGALIIGQAAVEAGLVSSLMIIVVSLTAISSFVIPHYETGIALRLLRFIAMICAAMLGLYGLTMFVLVLMIHFVKLKSFGIPYASPAIPYRPNDWKDFLFRAPLMMMRTRSKLTDPQDLTRQGRKG